MGAGKQIGTYHLKVVSGTDRKKLADGTTKKYKYGMVVVRTPDLTEKIGDKVMIRVFEEEDKPKKAKP
jgi:hypothetical protein